MNSNSRFFWEGVSSLSHVVAEQCMVCWSAGGLAVTAGGTSLCVWDTMAGGRLLQRLSQHQKTVTCVALSPLAGPDTAAAPRMLSGSLDGHVKVRDAPGCWCRAGQQGCWRQSRCAGTGASHFLAVITGRQGCPAETTTTEAVQNVNLWQHFGQPLLL